jgi:Flp pilus assembly protein TadG
MSKPRKSAERGETLVEFALTLFVLLMTIFGTIQFGLAVWHYNMMSDLAQEGARWASVRGSTSGAQKATAAQVQSFVQGRALGMNVAVTTSADPQSLTPGSTITVSVQHTFAPLTRIVPAATLNLGSTAQMVIAR